MQQALLEAAHIALVAGEALEALMESVLKDPTLPPGLRAALDAGGRR